jgi:outer membrane protein assembly factor BamA
MNGSSTVCFISVDSLINFQINYSLLKQDSTFINRGFKLSLSYPVGENGSLRFFSSRQAGDLFGVKESLNGLPSLVDFRWTNYGLGYYLDGFDNPFFPRKGLRLEGEFKLGNKRLLPNTTFLNDTYEQFKSSSTQLQASLSIEKHAFINKYWGMWLRLKSGYLGNENLFLNELSRLGGLKSIRGFNELFFFSDRYAFMNIEQRLFLGKASYLLAFGDFGWLNNPFLNPSEFALFIHSVLSV